MDVAVGLSRYTHFQTVPPHRLDISYKIYLDEFINTIISLCRDEFLKCDYVVTNLSIMLPLSSDLIVT